ncbi:MAG: nucleotidyltransferase substrate binding protein [Magnetococcales bacterium]|nr:nucleotidyltransferase substrate binding protein [Magnetococcales bacterium]
MIDHEQFRLALIHLEKQLINHLHLPDDQPPLIREAVAESVIHRFETCYDALWKVLKRHLHEELGVPDVPNSPKPILRLAHKNALLPSPIEQWLRYADARTATSHDYSDTKAQHALTLTGPFLRDAIRLYQTLSGQTWR